MGTTNLIGRPTAVLLDHDDRFFHCVPGWRMVSPPGTTVNALFFGEIY